MTRKEAIKKFDECYGPLLRNGDHNALFSEWTSYKYSLFVSGSITQVQLDTWKLVN